MGPFVERSFLNKMLFGKYGTLCGALFPEQAIGQEIWDHFVVRSFLNNMLFRKYVTHRGGQFPGQAVAQEIW